MTGIYDPYSGAADLVELRLAEAYKTVRNVEAQLDMLGRVDGIIPTLPGFLAAADQVQDIAAKVEDNLAYAQVLGRYYESRAVAAAQLPVNTLFTSDEETGILSIYRVIGVAPYYLFVATVLTNTEAANAVAEAEGFANEAAAILAGTAKSSDLVSTDATKGASLIGYKAPFTNATGTNLRKKAEEQISVLDFGANATGTVDTLDKLQKAEDDAAALALSLGVPVVLYWPHGRYAISGSINKKANVHWRGPGRIERLNADTGTGAAFSLVKADTVNDWSIEGLSLRNVTRARELAAMTASTDHGLGNTLVDVFNCARWEVRRIVGRQFTSGVVYRQCEAFKICDNILIADTGKTVESILDGTYENFSSYANTTGIGGAYSTSIGPYPLSKNFTISGNYIEIPGLDIGIYAHSQTFDKHPSFVTGNTVVGCLTGIQLYRGSFLDPGDAESYASLCFVTGNRVYASWGAGISSRMVIGTQATGNILERCGAGGYDGAGSSGAFNFRVHPFNSAVALGNATATAADGWITFTGGPSWSGLVYVNQNIALKGTSFGGLQPGSYRITAVDTANKKLKIQTVVTLVSPTLTAATGSMEASLNGGSYFFGLVSNEHSSLISDNKIIDHGYIHDPAIGDTTSGSAVITNVSNLSHFGVGMYVTLSSGFASVRRLITAIDRVAGTMTVNTTANATVTGATIYVETDSAILLEHDNIRCTNNEIIRTAEVCSPLAKPAIAILAGNGKNLSNIMICNNKISGMWDTGINVSNINHKMDMVNDSIRVERNELNGSFIYGFNLDCWSAGLNVEGNVLNGTFSLAAVAPMRCPYARIINNRVMGSGDHGFRLPHSSLAGDVPMLMAGNGGGITANNRRGSTVRFEGNSVHGSFNFPFMANLGNSNDNSAIGRCATWVSNYLNGALVPEEYSNATVSLTNNPKTFSRGDVVKNSTPTPGQPNFRICTSPGQCGSSVTATGTSAVGSAVLTGISSLDGWGPGIFLTHPGFSGVRKVIAVDIINNTVTLDANATSAVTDGTLTPSTPVFTAADTGWAADSGTAKKTANTTYTPGSAISTYTAGGALTASATYTQAELSAVTSRIAAIESALATLSSSVSTRSSNVENALRDATQTIKAIKDRMIADATIAA